MSLWLRSCQRRYLNTVVTRRGLQCPTRTRQGKLQSDAVVRRRCSTVQGEVRVRFAPSPTGKLLTKTYSVRI